MPGTIKDEKSAIAQTSGVELQRHRAQSKPAVNPPYVWRIKPQAKYFASSFQRHLNDFADTHQFTRKLGIGRLAALLLVCLAVRVDAEPVNLDCPYLTYVNCRGVSRFLDLDRFINSMYAGGPKQFISSRHDGCYVHLKTGDYLDKWWYRFLDEGQYYYLDRMQYKLLGGASYILGHPCYPKLFERRSEQAVGFTNRRSIYIPWYDCCWNYLTISNPDSLGNVCMWYIGPMPADTYVFWHSCFKAGDNIEKWRYSYLDKGRYYALDETQYTWLGGLAYEFETPYSGIWHIGGSPYSYCLLKNLTKENIIANQSPIPEPATIGLLGLGALGVLILGNKRRTKK